MADPSTAAASRPARTASAGTGTCRRTCWTAARGGRRRTGREALVELGGGAVTYRQLWDRAARVAGGLRAAGVRPGDRVANRLRNGVDWVLAFWGTLLAGAVVVPGQHPLRRPPRSEYVVDDSGAAYVVEPGAPLPDGEPLAMTDQGHRTWPRSSTPAARRGSPRAR